MIDVILWYPSNSKLAEPYYQKNLGKFSPSEADKFLRMVLDENGVLYPRVGVLLRDTDTVHVFSIWYFDSNGALNIVFCEK